MLVPVQTTAEPLRLPHDRDEARQWMTFHLADGRTLHSRQVNWRNVPLADVVEVQFHLKGQEWGLRREDCPSTLLEFIVFRTAGMTRRTLAHPLEAHPVVELVPFNSWTFGWTDGLTEYLDEFDWKSGLRLRRYTLPRDYVRHPTHFHPASRV